jgi:hypothetical protein
LRLACAAAAVSKYKTVILPVANTAGLKAAG